MQIEESHANVNYSGPGHSIRSHVDRSSVRLLIDALLVERGAHRNCGIRPMLMSALSRPLNSTFLRSAYSLGRAAKYLVGTIQNHLIGDGNDCPGLVAGEQYGESSRQHAGASEGVWEYLRGQSRRCSIT